MNNRNLLLLFSSMVLFMTACKEDPSVPVPLSLPNIFSDHLILQQNDETKIWGRYTPGEDIRIFANWNNESITTSDKDGNWMTSIKTPQAGGSYSITIETVDSTITLGDVLIGEVWLASGQSNMEMPVKGWPPNDPIINSEKHIEDSNYPFIRMFTVQKNFSAQEKEEVNGQWLASSPINSPDFSATGYFFARKLYQQMNVPIGIIHSSWGGTPAEAWTSSESLRTIGDFNAELDIITDPERQNKIDNWIADMTPFSIPTTKEDWNQFTLMDEALASIKDDAGWSTIDIPGRIDLIDSGEMDGAVWISRQFEMKDLVENADYLLYIEAIDDMDVTYINGKKVGSTMGSGFYNTPREYNISSSILEEGVNTIAIRIVDTGGPGMVNAPINISGSNGFNQNLEGAWKSKVVAEIIGGDFYKYNDQQQNTPRPEIVFLNKNTPSVLYNAMIHPLIPYTIRGAIWYQGESNVGRADQYKKLFPAMINDWRARWGKEFPFYYVQIAPYLYNPDPALQVSQELREAQRLALSVPKTGMAVTLDIGNPTNIHPGNKSEVGSRLALWALAQDYDMAIVPSGPLYKDAVPEGNKIVVSFDYVGGGLVAKKDVLRGFEIAGDNGVFHSAYARIEGDVVEVSSSAVPAPKYVRYAWRDDSEASLFNVEKLPASSFSSVQ